MADENTATEIADLKKRLDAAEQALTILTARVTAETKVHTPGFHWPGEIKHMNG